MNNLISSSASNKSAFGNNALADPNSDKAEFDEMNVGVVDYLCEFQPALLHQLYNCPAACLAVFRELESLSQNIVLRLIFIEQPIPQAVVSSWVKVTSDYNKAAESLSKLHVWKACPMPTGLAGWLLNSTFRESLKSAWLGGGKPRSIFKPLVADKHKPDLETLDNYAINKRWDSILNFMAGVKLKDSGDNIGETTKKIILHAGLIETDSNQEIIITASGFQFLLMDISSQIWFFLRKYLGLVENLGLNFIECLGFLFELNFLTLGNGYSTDGMSDTIQPFLQHLREMGLIYQRKRKDGRFYPTRLMVQIFDSVRQNFASIASGLSMTPNVKRQGFIVVETNYRVYAYTESPLQIALLTLFIELNYRFPKFVAGFITRDSVRAAFKNGITAKQITHYLTMHSHPCMHSAKRSTVIPSTIIDQVFLWEQERNRLSFREGVLYSQFNSQPDYEVLRKYANDLGVIIIENPGRRLLVVTNAGHEEVRRFWRRYKKERD